MLTQQTLQQPQQEQEHHQLLNSNTADITNHTSNDNDTTTNEEHQNHGVARFSTRTVETYFDADTDYDSNVNNVTKKSKFAMDNLDIINENYNVNIETMDIADETMPMPQSNEPDKNVELSESETVDQVDCPTMESGVAAVETDESAQNEENDEAYSLARIYEIEIDRNEEEQTISEVVEASGQGKIVKSSQNNRMRVAIGVILRLMLPLANGVMRGFKGIRDARLLRILNTIASSRQALTSLVAFAANTISLNLSSVQVSHRIEPIMKLFKIRKSRDGVESLPDLPSMSNGSMPSTPISTTASMPMLYSPSATQPNGLLSQFPTASKRKSLTLHPPPPKCCTLNIMAEPPPGEPIRADIVFIHGLHGSQANTWKQGLWENERQPVGFERPPKPPVRPPKRPRHSRTVLIHPPHKQKRARHDQHRLPHERNTQAAMDDDGFFDAPDGEIGNQFSYMCGEAQDIEVCDGIEYSFPTLRLRVNDNGRQLQADLESMIKDSAAVNNESINQQREQKSKSAKGKSAPKPSPNDPGYSKCWPGDWLPLDYPGVRVIALNYTTDQYLWRPLWKKKEARSNLIERSREMAELLIKHRVGYGHPIVWVGHSKGGLFVKQIIVDAWESGRPAMAPFWRSARGVFFYSVPHRGSHLASIKAPLLTRSVELLDIEKNCKYLLDLHRRFVGLYHLGHLKIEVFSFVETALTLMSVLYLRIVGVDSADPGIGDVCGIRLDHREICKPRSRECILYKELVKMIKKVC